MQFEAGSRLARESTNPNDFALVVMLGLLGLRIFEATGASIDDLGEERGHRVLCAHSKGDKVVLVPLPSAVTVGEKRGWRLGRIIDPFGHERGRRASGRLVAEVTRVAPRESGRSGPKT